MTRTHPTHVTCLALCGAALLMAGACKKAEKKEEVVAPVRVSPAIKGSIRLIVNVDAVLYPRDQANIVPKISAPVRRFLVNRGDHVKQGQLLAELENRDLVAAATESKGQLDQAESAARVTNASVPEQVTKAQTDVDAGRAQADAAQKLVDSRQQLLREGAIARKQVDEAQVALAQARAHGIAPAVAPFVQIGIAEPRAIAGAAFQPFLGPVDIGQISVSRLIVQRMMAE